MASETAASPEAMTLPQPRIEQNEDIATSTWTNIVENERFWNEELFGEDFWSDSWSDLDRALHSNGLVVELFLHSAKGSENEYESIKGHFEASNVSTDKVSPSFAHSVVLAYCAGARYFLR